MVVDKLHLLAALRLWRLKKLFLSRIVESEVQVRNAHSPFYVQLLASSWLYWYYNWLSGPPTRSVCRQVQFTSHVHDPISPNFLILLCTGRY